MSMVYRFSVVAALWLCLSLTSFSQNKTLGVGTSALNPNAALHVESPGSNQGILIPRLTTAQRTTLSGALGVGDNGLILFDTDIRALAIWNGTSWDIGSKVGAPISIDNTATTGSGATIINSDATNSAPALSVNTNGTGNAIETTGKIQAGQFVGDGSLLSNLPGSGWGLSGNAGTNPVANFIGTSDNADFSIKTNNLTRMQFTKGGNAGINTSPSAGAQLALGSSTYPSAFMITVNQGSTSQSRGIQVSAQGSQSQNIGVYSSGFIDSSNGAIGLYGEAIGSGTSDAFGVYGVTNNFTSTTGKSVGVYGTAAGGATNWAGYFADGNVAIENGLAVGDSRDFGSNGAILTSSGPGADVIWSPSINLDNGATSGSAAAFTNSHGANIDPAVILSASDMAMKIAAGGVQLSVVNVSTPSTINGKAAVFNLTASGSYTLGTTGRVNGEIVYLTAETNGITINGLGNGSYFVTLDFYEAKAFIYVNGMWRVIGASGP